MKIAVNTRLLIKGKLDGIGWFTNETMKRIVTSHPEHDFYFIFDRSYDRDFIFADNVHPIVVSPPSRHPVLWWIYFGFTLPAILKKIKPDVFISTDGYLPANNGFPMLDVIHDVNFEHFPKLLPPLVRWYYRHFFPKYARKATRIATVSEFSKTDIGKTYKIEPSKIDVVYNGVSEIFHPVDEAKKAAIQKKYSGGHPYLIFVGSLHERKNIINTLKAFDKARAALGEPLKFVIAGKKMWWTDEMENTLKAMQFKDEVVFTGRVDPQSELAALTASAEAMLYIPFFEGFGIPVIEAQRCEVPVITSNTSSLPEVSGGGAQLCNPNDVSEISVAIQKVLKNENYRKDLITLGQANAAKYNWDRTAELLWESLMKTVDGKA